jgi:predicted transposase YbfD/YdcC
MSLQSLVEEMGEIPDPRSTHKVEHLLIDILMIAVCAVIAGAESWVDMALYAQSKELWLRKFLLLPNGIPSHDTFRRVFMLIDPARFEACFEAWATAFGPALAQEIVAIDGKTIRRSFDRARKQAPYHLASAWASERGLVLGQRSVTGKSHEITAIPELLDTLDLRGTLVTLDAMGCQEAIVKKILDQGADYLVTLKANQRKSYQAVQDFCQEHCFGRTATQQPICDEFDEGHGRLVRRRVFDCREAITLEPLRRWAGLQTVLMVESIRGTKDQGVTSDIRYFLCSSKQSSEDLAQAIRKHWQIENNLHWVLDVTFREDQCRIRDCVAAQNIALLRKIAINLVRRHQGSKASLRGRRKMAAWNNHYMEQIITGIFHA